MGKKDLVCPKCYQVIKTMRGRVQDHKVRITLSNGQVTKATCPGVGKKAV